MNTKALRQKVLDLAIHGKLVPQNPNDESATVLLEKIRAEKAEKIKKGELKADKKDSFIFVGSDNRHYEQFADGTVKDIEDEIPFEVPEGWAWCRLGELFYHTTGKALKKTNNKGSLRKYITTSNLYWNKFDFTEVREMYFTDDELEKCTIKKGDLILCNGGDVGRAAIWNYDEDICYQNHVSRLRPKIEGINNKLYLYLLMFYKEQGMLNGKGVGITSLSANDLLSVIFPLPPLNEQNSIVSSIENIFEQIEYLNQEKSDLRATIKRIKSKILELAIHGKLVPQDPNDEPAEELLKRIATSDNRPYKKFEEEIPFDIPESWAWSSMKDIVTINPKNKLDDNLQVSFIPMTLIDAEYKNTHGQQERLWKDIKKGFTHFAENDVAIAKISPCFENRKSVVLKNLKNGFGAGTTELYILRSYGAVLPEYIMWLAKSDNFINTGVGNFSGVVGQQRLARDIVEDYPVPLPPLTEQQRIVTKIEELFSYLDTISSSLE